MAFPSLPTAVALRRILLGTFLLGSLGTLVELRLLEHTEDRPQWIPLVLLTLGIVEIGWYAIARTRAALLVFRATMWLHVAAGTLGIWLHYKGNADFEREMEPTIRGWELFRESMMGATPALAPGTMVQLALIGLAFAFRHPLLSRADGSQPHPEF